MGILYDALFPEAPTGLPPQSPDPNHPYQPAPGEWMLTGQLQWRTTQILGPWEGSTEWA